MTKKLLLTSLLLLWIIFGSQIKALPIVGPVIGLVEFVAVLVLLGTILYQLGLHLYLWFKVRKED